MRPKYFLTDSEFHLDLFINYSKREQLSLYSLFPVKVVEVFIEITYTVINQL
jgi:hypothetical protein